MVDGRTITGAWTRILMAHTVITLVIYLTSMTVTQTVRVIIREWTTLLRANS